MENKGEIIFGEWFRISLITYLILFLVDIFFQKSVSDFFDLNILLAVVLFGGLCFVISKIDLKNIFRRNSNSTNEEPIYGFMKINWDTLFDALPKLREFEDEIYYRNKEMTENEWYFIILVSFSVGYLIYFKTRELGNLSIAISILAGGIILLASFLIFTDNE
jgi:hypothetical protein